MNWLFHLLAFIAAGFWLGSLPALISGFRRVPNLRDLPALPDSECPRLSIIVPACNEAETVEPAMRSLLRVDYPSVEIIAVEDRSTDATGEILDRLAQEDPRLRVLHLRELPPGWLGKNNALHQGAAHASGDWLLFTDADVVYEPDALRRALALAQGGEWDHLVVYPLLEAKGFWERAFISFFMVIFNIRFRTWEAAKKQSKGYVGVGAFNLVRASVYQQLGGHERLKMDVADDVHLGKLIKLSGYRQCLSEAPERIRVRWAFGLRGIIHVLTKNAFAGHDYSWLLIVRSIIGLGIVAIWPWLGLFTGPILARALCGATLAAMFTLQAFFARRGGIQAGYALAWPLAALLFLYISIRSGVLTERQGGVYWRGTFYPLADLRRGLLRG